MSEDDEEVTTEAATLARAGSDGKVRRFPCTGCAADLVCPPGANELKCPYCGTAEAIPLSAAAIREFSLAEWKPPKKAHGLGAGDHVGFRCAGCGAVTSAPPETEALPCSWCGGHLERQTRPDDWITPEAVLPFAVDRPRAEDAVRGWIRSLWFAPNDLKRLAGLEGFSSLYLPFYTFDSHTLSHYSGQAGYHYWVTVGSGKNRHRVRRTRWVSRSGVHEEFFDDVLVPGGTFARGDQGYRLSVCEPYAPAFLAGHSATRPTIEPPSGWGEAQGIMASAIHKACCRHIGGDTQRFVQVQTAHRAVTFKLVLLPRWQGGFRYQARRYGVEVNGQTATVTGDRPWSRWKIALTIIAGLIVVGIVVVAILRAQHG